MTGQMTVQVLGVLLVLFLFSLFVGTPLEKFQGRVINELEKINVEIE